MTVEATREFFHHTEAEVSRFAHEGCLRSVGIEPDALPATAACWRRPDACNGYTLDDPRVVQARVEMFIRVGTIMFACGALLCVVERLFCKGASA